jgi:hypothetical protein
MPYRATPDAAELWLRIIAAIGMLGVPPGAARHAGLLLVASSGEFAAEAARRRRC